MIHKIIHYCWFGGAEKPKLAQICIKSWKKYCKGYKIIEWNESNFDLSTAPLFVQDAYKAKKWAFVTDYVRLKVIYDNGGIYLDTDVELIKKIDSFLAYPSFFGMQTDLLVATGLGFGAEKGAKILKDLMGLYDNLNIDFNEEISLDIACPFLNLKVFEQFGLKKENKNQVLTDGSYIFSTEYFCPMNFDFVTEITNNTVSIHWFSGSWTKSAKQNENQIEKIKKQRFKRKFSIKYNLYKLLGENRYNKFVSLFKKEKK